MIIVIPMIYFSLVIKQDYFFTFVLTLLYFSLARYVYKRIKLGTEIVDRINKGEKLNGTLS